MPAVIKDVGVPMGMEPLPRIFMFVERCSIESSKRKFIGGKMGRDPIDDHANPLLMEIIDKVLKIFRRSKTACRGVITADLIAPRLIERMLANRHQFNMAKSHLFAILSQLVGQLPVTQILFPRP